MAFFTEQMETLTHELLKSRPERKAFVGDVKQRSHKLLADAQTFMRVLGQDHVAMAEHLRSELTANLQERLRTVQAERQQNREHFQTMRKEMQATLAQTRLQRKQHVATLLTECRTAQKDLAGDLKQAAKVWAQMFQVGAATNGGLKGKAKVTAGATVTPAAPVVKAKETAIPAEPVRMPTAEAKEPTPAASSGGHKGMGGHASPAPKVEETGKHQEHGRGHAAETKEPTHGNHGNQGKTKESRHSH